MFGNPNASATPVDDLYSSQADVYGNSFANPVNPANMNSGWGIDPSLLTPSYTAGYRPGYDGPNGATDYNRQGFFSSASKLGPWHQTPQWGNPTSHLQDNVDSVASRPIDAAMWGAQRLALPVAAFAASRVLMGGTNAFGMSKGAMKVGRSFGRGLGGGLARGIGMRGVAAAGMAAVTGGAMALAAGVAAPLVAMQGIAEGAERGIFNPYINTRRSAEDLRSNFSGITFGDSTGNTVTGGGLGGRESANIAANITRDGIRDMSLSTGEYGAVANMVGRSGLADNVNSKQISKRVKDSADQMKLIMSIANMPEMQEAIEQLAKLQKMGANVSGGSFSDAAGTMRQLGGLASVAGTNVQKLMNTVGAQGQYLYQANGMTPHLGQLAAANSYASLSAGNRMGLISSSQMARMGGLDGATQASLTGQINASQTLYNKMSNFNGYMNGGSTGSMISNMTKFGQSMASDPMGAYGGMMLHGRQMAGRQISERGSLAVEDQVWEMLKNQPGMVDKNGKISIERATPFMMQMGMNEDQIHAFASQRIGETNKGVYGMSMKAMDRNLIEQQQQLVEKNDWYGGVIGRSVHAIKQKGRNVTEGAATVFGTPMAKLVGSSSDSISGAWNDLWFGDTLKSSNTTINDALGIKDPTNGGTKFDTSRSEIKFSKNASYEDMIKESEKVRQVKYAAKDLNDLKERGDPDALAYFNAKTPEERQRAITALSKNKKWSPGTKEFLDSPANFKGIETALSQMPRIADSGPKSGKFYMDSIRSMFGMKVDVPKTFKETVRGMGGLAGKDEFDNMQAGGLAYEAATKVVDGDLLATYNIDERLKTDKDLQRLSKMTGKTGQDLLEYINKTSDSVVDNKLVKLSTSSLAVEKGKLNSDDALKKASERVGGGVYDTSAIETKHLGHDEKMQASLALKQDQKSRADLTEKLKAGHLDFSGYQATVNALDNKETVKKFSDAVDKFVSKVEGDTKPTGLFGGLFGSGSNPAMTDNSNQKLVNRQSGN